MPFIGRDWRSPGEAWVKTESLGWQRMKIIESQLHVPASCYQNPACSWPPRSEFGKHMENNCNGRSSHYDHMKQTLKTYSGSVSSDNSSDGSSSTSPTGSPEKNSVGAIVAPNHPIIISSPYGTQYTCCAHYHCNRPQRTDSPGPKLNCDLEQSHPTMVECCHNRNAQSNSRSLSPELINITNNNRNGLKYNNSISDFRSASASATYKPEIELNAELPTGIKSDAEGFNSETHATVSSSTHSSNQPRFGDAEVGRDEQIIGLRAKPSAAKSNDVQDENLNMNNSNCCCASSVCGLGEKQPRINGPCVKNAPHCRISVRTREVAMYNTISEAFYRLDFCNAIHDIRRFNYICKLLHLLITQNLTSLSGCATRVLFNMLEQVAWEVSSNKRNIHVIRNLLNELRQMIEKYYCWGRPIGSSVLWQQHFDTIERISQIVDRIELSPPNNGTKQTRFDNLPTEMVREILLRLNDYRDLVNSAQASPVMRTMIDSQLIWKRLCRYHFSEQQLKIAFKNNRDIPLVNRGSQRGGTKYARTASADGKSSYRNPVGQVESRSSSSKLPSTTRRQLEQTNQRRNSSRSRDAVGRRAIGSESSSYVTNAIKIFDNDGQSDSSSQRRSSRDCAVRENNANSNVNEGLGEGSNDGSSGGVKTNTTRGAPTFNNDRSTNSQEIDWERVFHQLRKKFDLKEEYADCLLLCRQCRCLFWKSFGHPCILKEDQPERHDRESIQDQPTASVCNCHRLVICERQPQGDSQQRNLGGLNDHNESQNRPSVALLSRNFDNRALASGSQANEGPVSRRLDGSLPSEDNQIAGYRQQARRSRAIDGDRRPLRDLNARPNNDNQLRQVRRAQAMVSNDNNNNSNHRNLPRNEELVPKHVTISPQAFLKFFSL